MKNKEKSITEDNKDMTHEEVVIFLQEHWNRESSTISSVQFEQLPKSIKRHFKELPLNSPFRT